MPPQTPEQRRQLLLERQVAEIHEAMLGDVRARRPGLLARVLRLEDRVGFIWKILIAVAAAVAVGAARALAS